MTNQTTPEGATKQPITVETVHEARRRNLAAVAVAERAAAAARVAALAAERDAAARRVREEVEAVERRRRVLWGRSERRRVMGRRVAKARLLRDLEVELAAIRAEMLAAVPTTSEFELARRSVLAAHPSLARGGTERLALVTGEATEPRHSHAQVARSAA